MTTQKMHIGYVVLLNWTVLVQIPATNKWGFSLCDDDQTFEGGLGCGSDEWDPIKDNDTIITPEIRARLQWILDEARA